MRGVILTTALLAAGCATTSPTYLAKVNDETIGGKELRQEFARHHYALEKTLAADAQIRKYLQRLVDRRLFVQEGRRIGLQDEPDVRDGVARARGQKLIDLFLRDEVDAKISVTDDEVKAVHDGLGELLEVRQVVVRTREEAEAVAATVASGGDLEALARERSIADSAKRGGMLLVGWGLDEAYERVLYPLPEGGLSPVFRSTAGWEIARVERRKKPEKPIPTLDKSGPRIRQILEKRRRIAIEEQLYSGLWRKYDAQVKPCVPDPEALKAGAARKDQTACATWRGGAVTVEALAGRVKLDQLAVPAGRWPELERSLLDDLVNRELVKLEAAERGYGARPEVVDRARTVEDELVEGKLYREHVIRDVKAGEDDARRYFEAHRDEFVEEARYDLAQIVVASAEEAATVAEKVRSRQPFAELAETYSKDRRSAADGGRVGLVAKSMLKDEFAPVVALGEGEVSEPLRSGSSYHVVKVLAIQPEKPLPFDDVKDRARTRALEERQRQEVERWVAKLRAAATIEINEAGIRAYGEESRELLRREEDERRAAKTAGARPDAAPQPAAAPALGPGGAATPGAPQPAPASPGAAAPQP